MRALAALCQGLNALLHIFAVAARFGITESAAALIEHKRIGQFVDAARVVGNAVGQFAASHPVAQCASAIKLPASLFKTGKVAPVEQKKLTMHRAAAAVVQFTGQAQQPVAFRRIDLLPWAGLPDHIDAVTAAARSREARAFIKGKRRDRILRFGFGRAQSAARRAMAAVTRLGKQGSGAGCIGLYNVTAMKMASGVGASVELAALAFRKLAIKVIGSKPQGEMGIDLFGGLR